MFVSPVEAIQHAPPLNCAMSFGKVGCETLEAPATYLFAVEGGEKWLSQGSLSSCVAKEFNCGKVFASGNQISVSLSLGRLEFSNWVLLPPVEGTTLSVSLERSGDEIFVAAGTNLGVEVFVVGVKDCAVTVLNHVRSDADKQIRFVEVFCERIVTVVGVDESGKILSWSFVGGQFVATSVVSGRLLQWLSWVRSDQFVHAAKDTERRHLLVLSKKTLTVWSPESGTKGVLQVGGDVVAVHASHGQDPFLAVLIFASGCRRRVHSAALTHGAISMSVDEVIEPQRFSRPAQRVAITASACNTTLMCCTDGMLLIEVAKFPFPPTETDRKGPFDVVSFLNVAEPVTGISVLPIDSPMWHCKFVVHGSQGSILTLLLRTVPHVLATALAQASDSAKHVSNLITQSDSSFVSDCLLGAHQIAIETSFVTRRCIALAIAKILSPTIIENKIIFSPLVSSVRRKYVEVSHRAIHELQEVSQSTKRLIDEISRCQRNTQEMFSEGGWLDVTHISQPSDGHWSDLGVELAHSNANKFQAAAAQALFLKELSEMLSFVKALCILGDIAMRSSFPIAFPSHLSQLLWCKSERQFLLIDIGMSVAISCSAESLRELDRWEEIPTEIQVLCNIKRECENRHLTAITRIFISHSKQLHLAGVMDCACRLVTSLGNAAVLTALSHWIPHDVSVSKRLLDFLSEVHDAKEFSSVAHFALAAPPQAAIEWIIALPFCDERREVLVELLSASMAKSENNTALLTLRGQFWYALTLLHGNGRERKDSCQLLMEVAQSKASIALSDRLIALQLVLAQESSLYSSATVSHLIKLCELQCRLLEALRSSSDESFGELLETQLLTEEALFRVAVQCSQVVRCAPDVQLALILRHEDLTGYNDAICSALESELLWLVRDGNQLVEALRILALNATERLSQDAFPISRFLVLMFAQYGNSTVEEMQHLCSTMGSCSCLDSISLFMAVGDILFSSGECEPTDVLAALVHLLETGTFSLDDRMRCLEIVSSHVALICSEMRDDADDTCRAKRHATVIDALKSLMQRHQSTSLLASQIMSALRNSFLQ